MITARLTCSGNTVIYESRVLSSFVEDRNKDFHSASLGFSQANKDTNI